MCLSLYGNAVLKSKHWYFRTGFLTNTVLVCSRRQVYSLLPFHSWYWLCCHIISITRFLPLLFLLWAWETACSVHLTSQPLWTPCHLTSEVLHLEWGQCCEQWDGYFHGYVLYNCYYQPDKTVSWGTRTITERCRRFEPHCSDEWDSPYRCIICSVSGI